MIVCAVIAATAVIIAALITRGGSAGSAGGSGPINPSAVGQAGGSRPGGGETSSNLGTPRPSRTGPTVGARGPATITLAQQAGYDVDRLAPADDRAAGDLDLAANFVNVSLDVLNASWFARADDVPATFEGCSQAQTRTSSVIVEGGDTPFRKVARLCLKTSDGNLASLILIDAHKTTNANDWWLRFNATVWQGDGS